MPYFLYSNFDDYQGEPVVKVVNVTTDLIPNINNFVPEFNYPAVFLVSADTSDSDLLPFANSLIRVPEPRGLDFDLQQLKVQPNTTIVVEDATYTYLPFSGFIPNNVLIELPLYQTLGGASGAGGGRLEQNTTILIGDYTVEYTLRSFRWYRRSGVAAGNTLYLGYLSPGFIILSDDILVTSYDVCRNFNNTGTNDVLALRVDETVVLNMPLTEFDGDSGAGKVEVFIPAGSKIDVINNGTSSISDPWATIYFHKVVS